jgi:hypothetical protein
VKWPRFGVVSLATNLAALAGLLVAIALGARSERLTRTAAFLCVSTAAALYVEAVRCLLRRRARNELRAEVPEGTLLKMPIWIALSDSLYVVGLGATFGAVIAVLGFASVGLGILLTFILIQTGIDIASRSFGARALMFEREGLRVYIRGATILVRWNDITAVEREGSEGHRLIRIRILHRGPVISSVQPNTSRTRRRARLVVDDGDGPSGALVLTPWMGGLDSAFLARAIQGAVSRVAN